MHELGALRTVDYLSTVSAADSRLVVDAPGCNASAAAAGQPSRPTYFPPASTERERAHDLTPGQICRTAPASPAGIPSTICACRELPHAAQGLLSGDIVRGRGVLAT